MFLQSHQLDVLCDVKATNLQNANTHQLQRREVEKNVKLYMKVLHSSC